MAAAVGTPQNRIVVTIVIDGSELMRDLHRAGWRIRQTMLAMLTPEERWARFSAIFRAQRNASRVAHNAGGAHDRCRR